MKRRGKAEATGREHSNQEAASGGMERWLEPETVGELAETSHFTATEISGPLAQRWSAVADGDGRANADVVCTLPELSAYPLARRALALHNRGQAGVVNFVDYVLCMSALSGRATPLEKLQLASKMYLDGDGSCTSDPDSLFDVLKLVVGRRYSDAALDAIAEDLLQRHNGARLSIADLEQLITPVDLAKLTL